MWFLRTKARPDPSSDFAARYGGANVCCWIDTNDEGEALAAADDMLRFYGWLMSVYLQESHPVLRENQPAKSLPYFDQAKKEGFAHVAITWPLDK
jgi:hypothetical protein